jgi:DNA relaxase NicK
MVRFDAYSATTTAAKVPDLVAILASLPVATVTSKQGKGFHMFGERIALRDETGAEFGAVMWGGRQGERVMFEVKGEHTPQAVESLRSAFPHRCTRVDACADFDAPGAFESLLGPCLEVKRDYKLKGSKAGDWDDYPEDGRTLYLGAPSSPIRARLYEKGKQPEYRHLAKPNWARIEVQVRPAKEAKTAFSALSAVEVWGASQWTRDLATKVLREHVDPHPAGSIRREASRDRALSWMCKQYGPHLVSLADDLGGWKELGLTLREMLREQQH